jgi:ribosome-associated protein
MDASAGFRRGRRSPTPVTVDLPITLGQFVKLAGLVSTGAEAKHVVAAGSFSVNGEIETRRGRKLSGGDIVKGAGLVALVVARTPRPSRHPGD